MVREGSVYAGDRHLVDRGFAERAHDAIDVKKQQRRLVGRHVVRRSVPQARRTSASRHSRTMLPAVSRCWAPQCSLLKNRSNSGPTICGSTT